MPCECVSLHVCVSRHSTPESPPPKQSVVETVRRGLALACDDRTMPTTASAARGKIHTVHAGVL